MRSFIVRQSVEGECNTIRALFSDEEAAESFLHFLKSTPAFNGYLIWERAEESLPPVVVKPWKVVSGKLEPTA